MRRIPEPVKPLVGVVVILGIFAGLGLALGKEKESGLALSTPTVVTAATEEAPRYFVFGDSTAEFFGRAMMSLDVNLVNVGLRRCPFRPDIHSGEVIIGAGMERLERPTEGGRTATPCAWSQYMPEFLPSMEGATAVLYAAPMMEVNFDDGNILDPAFQLVMVRELNRWVGTVETAGAKVVLVLPPRSRAHEADGGRYWLDEKRHANWLAVLRVVHEVYPSTCLVDYESWAKTQPENRPDGSHMEGQGAVQAVKWVLEQCNG